MARNLLAVTGFTQHLPGVFQNLPYGDLVNGPLWTLVHELRLYLALALLAVLCGAARSAAGQRRFLWSLLAATVFVGAVHLWFRHPDTHGTQWPRLAWMFGAGASLRVLAARVTLSWPRLAAMLAMLGAAAMIGPAVLGWVYPLLLPLTVL